MKTRSNNAAARRQIAREAARMLANRESPDFHSARRKAAARLGCRDQRCFPDNAEIGAALREYQLLFKSGTQPEALRQLRQRAVEAMQELKAFAPRLTGRVLDGTADAGSPVQLYLFADTTEQVSLYLLDRGIPFEQEEVPLRHAGSETRDHPVFAFRAGSTEFELILLPPADRSNPPLDALSEKPCLGAGLAQARALLGF